MTVINSCIFYFYAFGGFCAKRLWRSVYQAAAAFSSVAVVCGIVVGPNGSLKTILGAFDRITWRLIV